MARSEALYFPKGHILTVTAYRSPGCVNKAPTRSEWRGARQQRQRRDSDWNEPNSAVPRAMGRGSRPAGTPLAITGTCPKVPSTKDSRAGFMYRRVSKAFSLSYDFEPKLCQKLDRHRGRIPRCRPADVSVENRLPGESTPKELRANCSVSCRTAAGPPPREYRIPPLVRRLDPLVRLKRTINDGRKLLIRCFAGRRLSSRGDDGPTRSGRAWT